MSIRIDKQKLAEALKDVLPKLTVSTRLIETNDQGEYCEEFATQLSCVSIDPNVLCVASIINNFFCVYTYSAETTTETYYTHDSIIEHTHSLRRVKARAVIVEIK
jgi:hypothetical protein